MCCPNPYTFTERTEPAIHPLIMTQLLGAGKTTFASKEEYWEHLASVGDLPQGFKVGTSWIAFTPQEANFPSLMNVTIIALDVRTSCLAWLGLAGWICRFLVDQVKDLCASCCFPAISSSYCLMFSPRTRTTGADGQVRSGADAQRLSRGAHPRGKEAHQRAQAPGSGHQQQGKASRQRVCLLLSVCLSVARLHCFREGMHACMHGMETHHSCVRGVPLRPHDCY